MSAFPTGDWQFWAVTLAAVGAAAFIGWRMLGSKLRRKQPRAGKRRATLTIEGDPVEPGRKRED